MQPDTTPDLDELERMHSGLAQKRHRVAIFTPDANDSELVAQINSIVNALPWLLRAARERDELRARAEKAEADLAESKRLTPEAIEAAKDALRSSAQALSVLQLRFKMSDPAQQACHEQAAQCMAALAKLEGRP